MKNTNRIKILSKVLVLLCFWVIARCTYIYAQEAPLERCASMPNIARYETSTLRNDSAAEPTLLSLPEVIRIPVVVHVLHNNKDASIGGSNISDEQILSQIRVLNEDFRRKPGTPGFNSSIVGADVQIEFGLATTDPDCKPTTGITRTYVKEDKFNVLFSEKNIKNYIQWPNTSYLNIWVVSASGGFLAYAQFPNQSGLPGLSDFQGDAIYDGVIITHRAFGSRIGTAASGIYSYGRTATHEVGHWLGLFHTWGDNICSNGNFCECGEDYCDDVPACSTSNLGSTCAEKFSRCNGVNTTRNMTENYMDYSPDICMHIFTHDQKKRMRKVFEQSPDRNAILKSRGLDIQKIASLPWIENMESVNDIKGVFFSPIVLDSGATDGKSIRTTGQSGQTLTYQTQWFPIQDTDSHIIAFDYKWQEVEDTDTLAIALYTTCSPIVPYLWKTTGAALKASGSQNIWQKALTSIPLSVVSNYQYIKVGLIHRSAKAHLNIDNFLIYNASDTKIYLQNLRSPFFKLKAATIKENNIKFDLITQEAVDLHMALIDLRGILVERVHLQSVTTGTYQISTQSGLSGVYFLTVESKGIVFKHRIVFLH